MKWYKITLRLRSALVTPLMGDTLFGHICWGIRYHKGEKYLIDFLTGFASHPNIIISNGFPSGFLPRPLLLPAKFKPDLSIKEYETLKIYKKVRYLPVEWFFEPDFIFSEVSLLQMLIKGDLKQLSPLRVERMHNSINRLSGTVLSDQSPFPVNEIWYDKNQLMDVYALAEMDANELKILFEQGLENGYGADASTGKGWIEVKAVELESRFPGNGNRAMALGAFVPDGQNPSELRSEVFTKFGKLGGIYAHENNPFKKPLIMYAEGATMKPDNKNYCGTLVKGIHSLPHIVHHAFAPLIFFNEEGE